MYLQKIKVHYNLHSQIVKKNICLTEDYSLIFLSHVKNKLRRLYIHAYLFDHI